MKPGVKSRVVFAKMSVRQQVDPFPKSPGSRPECAEKKPFTLAELDAGLRVVLKDDDWAAETHPFFGNHLHAGVPFLSLFPVSVQRELQQELNAALQSLAPRGTPPLLYCVGPDGRTVVFRSVRDAVRKVVVQVVSDLDAEIGSGGKESCPLPDFFKLVLDEIQNCVDELLVPVVTYQHLSQTKEKNDPYLNVRSRQLIACAADKLALVHRLLAQTTSSLVFRDYTELLCLNAKIDISVSLPESDEWNMPVSSLYGVVLHRVVQFTAQYGLAPKLSVALKGNRLELVCAGPFALPDEAFVQQWQSLFSLARRHGYTLVALYTVSMRFLWILEPEPFDQLDAGPAWSIQSAAVAKK